MSIIGEYCQKAALWALFYPTALVKYAYRTFVPPTVKQPTPTEALFTQICGMDFEYLRALPKDLREEAILPSVQQLKAIDWATLSDLDKYIYLRSLNLLRGVGKLFQIHLGTAPLVHRLQNHINNAIASFQEDIAYLSTCMDLTPLKVAKLRERHEFFRDYSKLFTEYLGLPTAQISSDILSGIHSTEKGKKKEQLLRDMKQLHREISASTYLCPHTIDKIRERYNEIVDFAEKYQLDVEFATEIQELEERCKQLQPVRPNHSVEIFQGYWHSLKGRVVEGAVTVGGYYLGSYLAPAMMVGGELFSRYYKVPSPAEQARIEGVKTSLKELDTIEAAAKSAAVPNVTGVVVPTGPVPDRLNALTFIRKDKLELLQQAIQLATEPNRKRILATIDYLLTKPRVRIVTFIDTVINSMRKELNKGFKFANGVETFNLDTALEPYKGDHPYRSLTQLFARGDIADKTQRFNTALDGGYYDNTQVEHSKMVKVYLSKIYDFFQKKYAEVQNKPAELRVWKDSLSVVVDCIIDAHTNCVDQVLSQIEGILIDLLADETVSKETDPKARMQKRASYEIFKHRCNFIKGLCTRMGALHDDVRNHGADFERMVKQHLIEGSGTIHNIGAHFNNQVANFDLRLNEIETWYNAEYNPLNYLTEQMRNAMGKTQKLRNQQILPLIADTWFTVEDKHSKVLKDRLSVDPDADFLLMGGNITHAAALHFLHTAGIIKRR